jgi:hypothetical protein
MKRRTSRRSVDDDAMTCAANFEAALEAYLDGGDAEELLRASALVLGSSIPLEGERAGTIALLTGCTCTLEDYDDAGRAVRRWFALKGEPGVRH